MLFHRVSNQTELRVEERRAPIVHPACVSFAVKEHFSQWGKQECEGSSSWDYLVTTLWIVVCVSGRATQPGHFADLCSQRAERIGSNRGK